MIGKHTPSISDPKSIRIEKAQLRDRVRKVLAAMSGAGQLEASRNIISLLCNQSYWKSAQSVLLYAPLPEEPDVWPLVAMGLEEGKSMVLPRYIPETKTYEICPISHAENDIQIGKYGIREPASHCAAATISLLDFILVPGIAFDLHGHRLGRGKGFYDQLLKNVRGVTCGVAFDDQIVEAVPVEPHDMRVKIVLTPTRWVVV
jgi:5-formyltetrahydrofolate cyclo-ligase